MKMKMNKREFSDKPLDVPVSLKTALVFERVGDVVYTNVPHLVISHSPDGFNFGYAGSGPADLALNYCEWYLIDAGFKGNKVKCFKGKCFAVAYQLHQQFKERWLLSAIDQSIPYEHLAAWFERELTEELIQECSTMF